MLEIVVGVATTVTASAALWIGTQLHKVSVSVAQIRAELDLAKPAEILRRVMDLEQRVESRLQEQPPAY